ncbi:hypothetical protein RIF29_15287 [Crotalaria pallida]|uniref:Uncharacterized protein n=1 Tax=Crotalaria pallida TaxID=3830 RepID=A0AAN9FFC2_CROPI
MNGRWDWDVLRNLLPSHICDRIAAIVPPSFSAGPDSVTWGADSRGAFSLKSAYKLIKNLPQIESTSSKHFDEVWSWQGPQRGPETIMHSLRDCVTIRPFWEKLVHPRWVTDFFDSDVRNWLSLNFSQNCGVFDAVEWHTVFGVGIWILWKARNMWVFEGVHESSVALVCKVFSFSLSVQRALHRSARSLVSHHL